MKQNTFSLPSMPEMTFSVTKTVLDSRSRLNQHDSHIHEACEVYINLSGDVAFEVEDRIYAVSRGTVIVTMPYEYHRCIYRSGMPHEHFWITFSTQQGQDFLKLFFDREKGIGNRIDLKEPALDQLCGLLDRLLDIRTDALDRRILLLQFFRILLDGTAKEPAGQTDKMLPDVALALEYIDHNLQQELNIRSLAKICNISVNTLERHFKDTLGISPFEAIRRKRLFSSMMYLKSGSSVTEAALKSGFSDYSNYIQLFRKQFGITPGQYKRMLKDT